MTPLQPTNYNHTHYDTSSYPGLQSLHPHAPPLSVEHLTPLASTRTQALRNRLRKEGRGEPRDYWGFCR